MYYYQKNSKMEDIKKLILEQFEFDPYIGYFIKDFEEIILENKNKLNNIEVFIRNNSVKSKIINILDELSETEYIVKHENDKKEESYYTYHPDKLQNKRISELQEQININNKIIDELQKKLEELSIKVDTIETNSTRKRFWFF